MPRYRARILAPVSPTEVQWWPDAALEIRDGRIHAAGPWTEGPCDEDLRAGILVPGFIDAHIHFPQTRIVGSATGPLLDWLQTSTFPEEARFADPDHAAVVAAVFVDKVLRAGTTSAFVYSSVHPHAADALFTEAHRRGLNVRGGPVLMDAHSPDELMLAVDPALTALSDLVLRWHGYDQGRIEVAAIPRFALSCTEAMMRGAARLADAHGLWVSTHLSENTVECQIATERFDAHDYLGIYEDFGLVHDRSLYAHCIHLSRSEWDRFARAGAVVAHCPDSNDFLGSGGMPYGPLEERGIDLAMGTDIAAGRSFRIPRTLSYAYDNGLRQGRTLDPRTLFWWGTRGGALSLGWADRGAIEPGLWADLALFDVPPWITDEEGALAALIFDHDAGPARQTWVRGIPTL